MVKLLLNVRRTFLIAALCMMAAVASATPFKNIHVRLTVNETGRGRVYMKTEDPSNLQSRKSEDVKMKCTIGEMVTIFSVIRMKIHWLVFIWFGYMPNLKTDMNWLASHW